MSKATERIEELVDYLLSHNWEPWLDMYGDLVFVDKLTSRGQSKASGHYYLTSPDKNYSLEIKANTLVVTRWTAKTHSKVLTLKLNELSFDSEGVSCGLIKLVNPQPLKNKETVL